MNHITIMNTFLEKNFMKKILSYGKSYEKNEFFLPSHARSNLIGPFSYYFFWYREVNFANEFF
jgi:hypothetical protein